VSETNKHLCSYLPGVGWAPSIRLAPDVGVLVLVAELVAEIVHHITGVLYDVGMLAQVADDGVAAHVLELGEKVGVGRGSKAGEDALLGQQHRAGADRKQCALAAGVLLLEVRIGRDEAERLSLLLQGLVDVTADDDEDVEVVKAVLGLLPGALRANDDALLRKDRGFAGGDGDLEGLGRCSSGNSQHTHSIGCDGTTQGPTAGHSFQLRGRCGVGNKDAAGWQLTGILSIMQGRGQDLERTSKVHEVEAGLQGKEHINWLVCHCGALTGHLWQRWGGCLMGSGLMVMILDVARM
jgi:hypothetical protein